VLLDKAGRVRAGFSEKVTILFLTVVDICIGFLPIGGDIVDIFFRVHSWNGNRLLNCANIQLAIIDRSRSQIAQGLDPDLGKLEDVLFRNGRTKRERALKYAAVMGILLLLLVGCVVIIG
ncbi:MAG: DUF4112 domain-containing protein, partial [Leptolyngbya sp. SIO4C1]|nr:DUF4112 domain-containing protein [Leptolyngbya sp. SIO4C1]